MEIKKAKRKETPVLINLYGLSGSGKTYSALRLAKGMLQGGGRIGLIDTENGRASHYANDFDFDVIDLNPPFTPERFLEAVKTFENAGYKIVIIDSFSHEWEGSGGCVDIAENKGSKGLAKWSDAKHRHKKMMNQLLYSKCHIIFCTRAKELLEQVGREIINKGFFPIQEKNFPFEMLVTFYMKDQRPEVKKCPNDLKSLFQVDNDYLTETHGKAILQWSKQGEAIDELEKLKKTGANAASDFGLDGLSDWWITLNKKQQSQLKEFKDKLKEQCGLSEKENNSSKIDLEELL